MPWRWLGTVVLVAGLLGGLGLPALAEDDLRMWGTPPREQPQGQAPARRPVFVLPGDYRESAPERRPRLPG